MKNKKKIFTMIALSLFASGVLSFGTYAIYNIDLITDNNSISTGQVKMSYSESNEITLNNAVPTSDKRGISSTNYFEFKVNTYIKTNKEMTMNYNIILEPLNIDSSYTKFNDSDIKVYLTKVDNNTETLVKGPITIDELNQYVLKTQEETFNKNDTEHSTTYRLRTWLDYNFDASKINEKTYSYKFRVNVNNDLITLDASGANKPELTSNMIPVYYDETSSTWKKADENNTDESNKWYDYDNKIWANAVTVTSTNRQTYLNASAGTEISMDDINTMWVWIPRYTYTYLNTNTPEEIQIKFESGTNSSGTIKCTDAVTGTSSTSETCTDSTNGSLIAGTSTYTHPAFTFGDTELTGIWVGKFEVSSGQIIKPNVTSLRSQTVYQFYKGIYNMRNSGNAFGFATTDETHMMKNMEWGAVTYLSHSKYGINKEIAINSNSSCTTGCGPQSEGSTSSGSTCNAYNTTLGQSASTTGNVYGVYDMSGGAYDMVMGNMVDSSGAFYSSSARFSTAPDTKYYDKYSYGTSNTEYTRGKLGDATKEMAPTTSNESWYSDFANFPNSSSSWFLRGWNYGNGSYAGAFGFSISGGAAGSNYSSRAVISNLK